VSVEKEDVGFALLSLAKMATSALVSAVTVPLDPFWSTTREAR
jgi:hypothetical protein